MQQLLDNPFLLPRYSLSLALLLVGVSIVFGTLAFLFVEWRRQRRTSGI